jgi:kinesin family protein 6/9
MLGASKTGIEGKLMKEAQFINLSLHFLEQVIVCLNQRAKGEKTHIPYRNSMMTMVLRDSLGGNCKTRMIATMSPNMVDFFESISTCKFAMRVSLIKNDAIKNEIEDPALLIQKQKREIDELKNELALVKGKEQKMALDKDDFDFCRKLVREYLADDSPEAKISLKDMLLIQECFRQIKLMFKDLESRLNTTKIEMMVSDSDPNNPKSVKDPNKRSDKELMDINNSMNNEIKRLKEVLKQRDSESKTMLDYIEKLKSLRHDEMNQKNKLLNIIEDEDKMIEDIKNSAFGEEVKFDSTIIGTTPKNKSIVSREVKNEMNSSRTDMSDTTKGSKLMIPEELIKELNYANSLVTKEIKPTFEIFGIEENKISQAYKIFKSITIHSDSLRENEKLLKSNFEAGKKLCEEVKAHKEEMNILKSKYEKVKKEIIIQEISNQVDSKLKSEEANLAEKINQLRQTMMTKSKGIDKVFQEKDSIGSCIESLTRGKIQKDFEIWYRAMKKLSELLQNLNSKKNENFNPSASNSSSNVRDSNAQDLNSSTLSNRQRAEELMKNVIS